MISTDQIAKVFARLDQDDAVIGKAPWPLAGKDEAIPALAIPSKKPFLHLLDPQRKCHSPECWCCHGTGVSQRPDIPGICDLNDKIPF